MTKTRNISDLGAFTPSGAGGVQRTVESKLRDVVSVKDFGAVGDGVTDDTLAIQAAINATASLSQGTLLFEPKTYIISLLTLIGASNLTFEGNGATLKKILGAGSNSMIINIKGGCSNIYIKNFSDIDGGYDSTNPTTGSNPVILIGDQAGNGDGGAVNQNIWIQNNAIRRSNWGGVVVYGRSGNAGTPTPLNKNIYICNNTITDCGGNGVFVYKNAIAIHVHGNVVDTTANNGIAFDTMAASDTVTTEAIASASVVGNTIRNFGKTGQGIGILFKGNITGFIADGNTISKGLVQPSGSFVNYAILVNKDAANAGATGGVIANNQISDVKSSLAGLGIVIGAEVKRTTVVGNSVFDCSGAGIQVLENAEHCSVTGNVVTQCGNATYGYRFEGLAGQTIKSLVATGNIYVKGASTATGGFNFSHVSGLIQANNLAADFTSSAFNVSNSTNVLSLRQFSATASPTSGTYAQGDIVTNPTTTTINPVDAWRCLVAGTPGTWRPASWITGRAPTASRPTLTATDIGVTYMDTSLNANGKPIWWTGTAWVDSTGAIV